MCEVGSAKLGEEEMRRRVLGGDGRSFVKGGRLTAGEGTLGSPLGSLLRATDQPLPWAPAPG